MRVLLTGATGLVGSHVARALVDAGHTVRVLVRAKSVLENLEGLDLERAEGDVTDPTNLGEAAKGCEAVVHTAGVASWSPLDTERVRAVNVDGTRHVVEAAHAAGVRRVVVTSSVAAIGSAAPGGAVDEASPWNLDALAIPYMTAKHDGEMVAFALGRERGLEVVAANPGFVTGPGDIYGSSSSIVAAVVKGKMPAFVEGGASVVDVRDVAAGHVAVLERGRAGERYILAGENFAMSAFMALIAEVAGVKAPKRVPYALAAIPARFADLKARLTARPQPLSMNLLRASALWTCASSEKAKRELGYSFRPVRTSLEDTLRWFLARGKLEAFTPALERLAAAPSSRERSTTPLA